MIRQIAVIGCAGFWTGILMLARCHASQLPPARYDSGNDAMTPSQLMAPFEDKITFKIVLPDETKGNCDLNSYWRLHKAFPIAVPAGYNLSGCFFGPDDTRKALIICGKDDGLFYDPLVLNSCLRHEIGHFLGWPAWHPTE